MVFMSSRVSLPSWGELVSLALVDHLFGDGVIMKIPSGEDVLLHHLALHPIFSYWGG